MSTQSASPNLGPPGLWVVGTPIGNLADVSPRLCAALESADVLLCEDTRTTRKLIEALGLKIPTSRLRRFDVHVEHERLAALASIVQAMREGQTFALLSDAGTPGVSDPGALLVRECLEQGISVTPIPGPSAVISLVSVAGAGEAGFTFRGFFPRKEKEREEELKAFLEAKAALPTVWFESANRILSGLSSVQAFLEKHEIEPAARIVVGKELTKKHERIFSGRPKEVLEELQRELEAEGEKGEFCFLIELSKVELLVDAENCSENAGWEKALRCLLDAGVSASVSAKKVSQYFGISRNEAYRRALEVFEKK